MAPPLLLSWPPADPKSVTVAVKVTQFLRFSVSKTWQTFCESNSHDIDPFAPVSLLGHQGICSFALDGSVFRASPAQAAGRSHGWVCTLRVQNKQLRSSRSIPRPPGSVLSEWRWCRRRAQLTLTDSHFAQPQQLLVRDLSCPTPLISLLM